MSHFAIMWLFALLLCGSRLLLHTKRLVFFVLSLLLILVALPCLADKPKKILLVEDTGYVKDSLEGLLRIKGFIVHTAESIEEGVWAWRVFKPDLVLLDMGLPLYPHGREIYRQGGLSILKLSPNDNAKVALSSNEDIRVFSSILQNLIDDNLNGKLMPSQIPILQELINTKTPPKRISILNELNRTLRTQENELRNDIHTLLLLKAEQSGDSKSFKNREKIQKDIEKVQEQMRKKLLEFQKIQESQTSSTPPNSPSGCMGAIL